VEYNIKIDLKQIECKSADWIYLAQDIDKRPFSVSIMDFGVP